MIVTLSAPSDSHLEANCVWSEVPPGREEIASLIVATQFVAMLTTAALNAGLCLLVQSLAVVVPLRGWPAKHSQPHASRHSTEFWPQGSLDSFFHPSHRSAEETLLTLAPVFFVCWGCFSVAACLWFFPSFHTFS